MKRIGRYIIRGLIGRGGMAKIFKVELPGIGKISALKYFDPDPLTGKLLGVNRLRDLFVTEARTMAGLNHPNIVAIQDFDEHDEKPFYVMEFFANNLGTMIGESYRTEKPSRRIAVHKALEYTRQTLNGLACMHDAGIYHRDIKPFNLLVTAWDTIRICDFGLSKLRGETFDGPANLNVGSPYYAAPEQEKNPDAADQRADLYAVGMMFYRMLTGVLPLHAPGHKSYRPPSRLNSDLDNHWDHFIDQSISVDPGDRFPDSPSMLQALDKLARHWQDQMEMACRLPSPDPPPPSDAVDKVRLPLRHAPLKVYPRQAGRVFGLDRLWRPKTYLRPDYNMKPDGQIVEDRSTGLIWQRSGSKTCLGWQQAAGYVDHLNREAFGGRRDWRLPTVDELISLLRPPQETQQLCIAPLFDTHQRWIWSSDRRSFIAAYYVDIELGFVGWQDFSAPFYVRAVCSVE